MKKIVSLIAAGSLALTLAACGGSTEVTTNVETNVVDLSEPANDMGNMAMPEAPPSNAVVTPVPADPGKEFGDETQTKDDADATGDTARVSRGEDNSSAPAQ